MRSISETLDFLSKEIKPYLEKLEEEIDKRSRKVSDIAGEGTGIAKAKQLLELSDDLKGIYVFIEKKKAIYVGISRSVLKRISQHVKGSSHNSASLAYKIAQIETAIIASRKEAMRNYKFKKAFDDAQKRILKCEFAILELEDDNLLYMLELVAAIRFDTEEYNSFRPH